MDVATFDIPMLHGGEMWILRVDSQSGNLHVLHAGEHVALLRYDPDLGFGSVPPQIQPLLPPMREALSHYDDRIRLVMRVW